MVTTLLACVTAIIGALLLGAVAVLTCPWVWVAIAVCLAIKHFSKKD